VERWNDGSYLCQIYRHVYNLLQFYQLEKLLLYGLQRTSVNLKAGPQMAASPILKLVY